MFLTKMSFPLQYQSKSTTPVDKYVCTLSQDLLQQAEEDLEETEEKRQRGIKELREWILKNPRIEKCRMDANFLLRFLRYHKYAMKLVKESIERYLIFREGLYGQDWFTNLDIDRPHLQEFLDRGMVVVLPNRSKKGEKIILIRCQAVDTKVPNAANVSLSLSTMICETLFDNEENQIRGFKYILDISNIGFSHYFIFPFNTWFRIMKQIERTFAARHRGCYLINMNSAIRFVANLALRNMREKMKNGMHFQSGIEELDFIDIKDLPKEYGGELQLEKLIEPYKNALITKKEFFKNYSNMKINKEFYTPAVLKCDASTLTHSLENKKAKYLTSYDTVDDKKPAKK